MCREKSRHTQQDVADYLELSRASIANYESGKQKISIAELYRLAEHFGVELMHILPSVKELNREVTPENKLDRDKNLEKETKDELQEFIKTAGNLSGGEK